MTCPTHCNCDQCLVEQMTSSDKAIRPKGWQTWYERDHKFLQDRVKYRCIAFSCFVHSQDIVQESFIIGFKNISSRRYIYQGKPLRAYLWGIAKNLIFEVYHLKGKTVNDEECILSLADDTISLEQQFELKSILHIVRKAYDQLPGPYRQVTDGLYRHGKSSKELGKELGKKSNNIRAIARRAVQKIKEYLERIHGIQISPAAIRQCLVAIQD